jgi:catechol 2,3-dioxygenase-like lactoylglutathione lyase family enzyme
MAGVVLDCPDPQALAAFYSELLGCRSPGRIGSTSATARPSASASSTPPTTSRHAGPTPAFPQQFHIDVMVDDIDEAELKVLALGTTPLPGEGSSFRVYADPTGHPFCLCTE